MNECWSYADDKHQTKGECLIRVWLKAKEVEGLVSAFQFVQTNCQNEGARLAWIDTVDEDRYIAERTARLGNYFNF